MSDQATNPPRLLLTATEAAEALAISPRTLWTLTQTGQLRAVRIGPSRRAVRYTIDELEGFIERAKRRPDQ